MPIKQLKLRPQDTSTNGFSSHSFGTSETSAARRPLHAQSTTNTHTRTERPRASFGSEPPRRTNRRGSSGNSGRKGFRRFIPFLIRAGAIAVLIGGIGMIALFALYSRDLPDPNKIIDRDLAQSTQIYDRTGETLLYEIHGTERRTVIELSDIPEYAINATISIEDKNFYNHKGISIPHVIKAIVLEGLSKVGLYRDLVPGGSTLTQQFIKNAILTTEKSYERKIKELVLANRLEKKFTKEEILKLYFNEIPYGSTAYGIETAAHIYFDKTAKDLTLAEAAVLAAMPQAPSYYSPYGSHKDELIGRQQYILDLMVEQGYITETEAANAKAQELVFKQRREDIKAPHFVFMVREQLAERYGERLVETGGLKIITTLDAEKQKIAEEVIAARVPDNNERFQATNASLVSIDVKTGEVLALVGSSDFFNDEIDGQVNVATSPRQPGSSLKPLIYAEAFAQGYRPETTVYDLVTSFAASGTDYKPNNYDLGERGPISLRSALQGSLNIPAVKVLYLIGVNRAVAFAQELGYTTLTDPDRYGLSLVLGGAEVKLIEHTNGYAAFAREGVAKPVVSVLRVEGPNGELLEEHQDRDGRRVLDREVARTLTNVLSDNEARAFIFGAANSLTLPGRPVAAKTGTTNDYHDAWTLGYTPSLATGVWVGNANNDAMKRGADGSVVAAPIWRDYMTRALDATPVEGFKAPAAVAPCSKPMVCSGSGERLVKVNIETGKLPNQYTPASKIKELSFRETHSILHYVKRGDPLGDIPENPADDPQYALWEAPIQAWAEKNGYTNQPVPTEVDDQYRPEDQPTVTWLSPSNGNTIAQSPVSFTVDARARRGVARIDYYLNDLLVGSSTAAPFSYSMNISPVTPNGAYNLRAVAIDDIGNEQSATVNIRLDVPRSAQDWSISWQAVTPGTVYTTAELPEQLQLTITNPGQLSKIDFYLVKDDKRTFIGSENVTGGTLTRAWTRPTEGGTYGLSLTVTQTSGAVITTPGISFTIF